MVWWWLWRLEVYISTCWAEEVCVGANVHPLQEGVWLDDVVVRIVSEGFGAIS